MRATRKHADLIYVGLAARGIDLDEVRRDGRLISLDAVKTLSEFMEGDRPNRGRFVGVVGGTLERARRRGGCAPASPEAHPRRGTKRRPGCATMTGVIWDVPPGDGRSRAAHNFPGIQGNGVRRERGLNGAPFSGSPAVPVGR